MKKNGFHIVIYIKETIIIVAASAVLETDIYNENENSIIIKDIRHHGKGKGQHCDPTTGSHHQDDTRSSRATADQFYINNLDINNIDIIIKEKEHIMLTRKVKTVIKDWRLELITASSHKEIIKITSSKRSTSKFRRASWTRCTSTTPSNEWWTSSTAYSTSFGLATSSVPSRHLSTTSRSPWTSITSTTSRST